MNVKEKKTNLYDYLESVLENGTQEEISLAKKDYWKKYKAEWRKNRRREQKEFTVSFNSKELRVLKPVVTKHKRSYTRFIKEATLTYAKQEFLVTDPVKVNRIKELLVLNYNSLQQLSEENILDEAIGNELMEKIAELESQILAILHNPKSLEQWLREITSDNLECKMKIIEALQTIEK